MSLRDKAIDGVFWTILEKFGTAGLMFLIQIVLARLILPEEFGLLGMILVFNAIGHVLVDSGMSQSLIRTDAPTDDDYSSVFFINLGVALVIYTILFLLAPYISDFYRMPQLKNLVRIYSLSIIINSFSIIQITKLTKELNFKLQLQIQIPSVLLSGFVGVTLAYLDYGVWALVWMEITRSSILNLQYWFRTSWRPLIVFNKIRVLEHFNFGYRLTISMLLNAISTNLMSLLLGRHYSALQVGYYTRASTTKNFPVSNLSTALDKVTYPIFAEAKNDNKKLKMAYKKIMQIILFVFSPLMFVLILIAEPFFLIIFGKVWLPAVPYFQILCLTGMFYPISRYNLNLLKVKGKSREYLIVSTLKQVILIGGLMIFVNYGIIALLITMSIISILNLCLNILFSGYLINYTLINQLIDSLKIILPGLIIFLIFFYLVNYLSPQNNYNYIFYFIVLILYLITYIGIQYIFNKPIIIDILDILKIFKNKVIK